MNAAWNRRPSKKTTWLEFLKTHRDVLAAADFFTVDLWTGRCLTRFAVLFIIELSTRRVKIAGITSEPDALRCPRTGNSTGINAFLAPARCPRSTGLILAAAILMRTSPLPGTGSGTSSYFKTSGPPYSCDRGHAWGFQPEWRAHVVGAFRVYPHIRVLKEIGGTVHYNQFTGGYCLHTLRSNRLDAIGEIMNLLNEESDGSVTSTIYAASTFGVPNAWTWPRRLYIGVRRFFR